MPAWMLATAVDSGRVLSNLVAAGIAAVVAAVVSSVLTSRILKDRISALAETVKSLQQTIETLEADLNAIRQERASCELKAARTYANRSELAQIIAEAAANHREFLTELKELGASMRDSIGKTHGRLDNALERIARLEAGGKGTPR